jgi:hypothetical protein
LTEVPGVRKYVVVTECTFESKVLKTEHSHLIEPDGRERCMARGVWFSNIDEVPKDSKWMKQVRGPYKKPEKEQ